MKEDYVSFEAAKLLKEKGFREWCRECYGTDVRHNGVSISFDEELDLKDEGRGDEIEYVEGGIMHNIGCNNSDKDIYAAPTLSIAMKWLREVHNICVYCYPSNLKEYGNWEAGACWIQENVCVIFNNNSHSVYADSYEEACEAAIKYCLENLI